MRWLLTIFIFSLSMASAMAAPDYFTIEEMENHPTRGGVFFLKGRFSQEVILDCASFLHGLAVNDQTHQKFLMLYESECHSLVREIDDHTWENRLSCLAIDFERKDWSYWQDDLGCPSSIR